MIKKLFSTDSKKSQSFIPEFIEETVTNQTGAFKTYRGKVISPDKIIKEGYQTSSVFYSVINKLINKSGDIPLTLTRTTVRGETENITEGVIFEALNNVNNPNSKKDQEDLIREIVGFLTLSGNAIIEKKYATGFTEPIGLEVLPTQNIEISENLKTYILTDPITQKERKISRDKIIHIKYFSPSNESITSGLGQSPIQAGFMTVDSGNDLKEANQFILKNQSVSGILSNDSENTSLRDQDAKALERKSRQKFGSPTKTAQILLTNAKIKWTPITNKGDELKIFDREVSILRDICNLYGVDSSLFNDPANKTYNNKDEAKKELYTEAISPLLKMITKAFNQQLLTEFDTGTDVVTVDADFSSVEALQKDKKQEAEKNSINSKSMTDLLTSDLRDSQKIIILQREFGLSESDAVSLVN